MWQALDGYLRDTNEAMFTANGATIRENTFLGNFVKWEHIPVVKDSQDIECLQMQISWHFTAIKIIALPWWTNNNLVKGFI